jgi:GNAT superfamily N-acetyltransferase
MEQFTGEYSLGSTLITNSHISVRERVEACIASQTPTANFRLRLAGSDDLEAICRLVNGLAVFEKDPDAVNVSIDHYRSDGLNPDKPLFYCLLLDYYSCEDDKWYACGMAFCYLGCTHDAGPFLYLEDLFLEEAYRGKGAGTFIMRTLAAMALSLDCSRLVWQALDWNTPAIDFYSKIGARVVKGLLTFRFSGQNLKDFGTAETDE